MLTKYYKKLLPHLYVIREEFLFNCLLCYLSVAALNFWVACLNAAQGNLRHRYMCHNHCATLKTHGFAGGNGECLVNVVLLPTTAISPACLFPAVNSQLVAGNQCAAAENGNVIHVFP